MNDTQQTQSTPTGQAAAHARCACGELTDQEKKSNSEARQRLSTCIRRQKIDLVRHNAITYGRCRRTLPVLRPKTTSPFQPYDPTAAIQLQHFASPTRT